MLLVSSKEAQCAGAKDPLKNKHTKITDLRGCNITRRAYVHIYIDCTNKRKTAVHLD